MGAVFIGLSMGTLAFLVDISLETLNNWKYDATREAIKACPGNIFPSPFDATAKSASHA